MVPTSVRFWNSQIEQEFPISISQVHKLIFLTLNLKKERTQKSLTSHNHFFVSA
jgi:hypothetical protein